MYVYLPYVSLYLGSVYWHQGLTSTDTRVVSVWRIQATDGVKI